MIGTPVSDFSPSLVYLWFNIFFSQKQLQKQLRKFFRGFCVMKVVVFICSSEIGGHALKHFNL